MRNPDLNQLLKDNVITNYHHLIFSLFEMNDDGAHFLENMMESIVMEAPPPIGEHAFSYKEGRLSVIREIKEVIYGVKHLLEGRNYDGTRREPEHDS